MCGTADLPAKAKAVNMVQFNGKFSCSRCLLPSRTEKTGPNDHTQIFPNQNDDPTGPVRSHKSANENSLEALHSGETVFGIKGPSFLTGLRFYDISLSTSIDYMHCVLLGITKKLMNLWFTATHSSQCFSLMNHIHFVDKSLDSIKPPHYVSRRPRSVSDHLKFWKASEYRAWLFFYSVPILCELMEPLYFFHYCAMAESIWICCKDSITENAIEHSAALLNYFVSLFEPLYGARYMTLNLHLLLHLPKCVQGPLFMYSCFPFESMNGDLLKLFHGTQHVETQILSAVNSHQILPLLISKMSEDVFRCSIVSKYLKKSKKTLGIRIDHDVYTVGHKVKVKLTEAIKDKLLEFLGHNPISIHYYSRLKIQDTIIHSENYTRVLSRNSNTVKYLDCTGCFQFGLVKFCAVHCLYECKCEQYCHCNNTILALVTIMQAV